MNVHVSRDGKVIGQFSEEEFRKNVRLGVIVPSDYYFCEGFTDWKLVADFKRKRLPQFKTIAGQVGALLVVSWFMPNSSDFPYFYDSGSYRRICGCGCGNREEQNNGRDPSHSWLCPYAVYDCRSSNNPANALRRFT